MDSQLLGNYSSRATLEADRAPVPARPQSPTAAREGRQRLTIHDVKLRKREQIAEGTFAFHFTKPTGFKYEPGQSIQVMRVKAPGTDAQSVRHTFSIVSAPFEDELIVATRMRVSAFKWALKSMSIGASARIGGPSGSLTLENNGARPAVFIAGGIGITPFISILRRAAIERSRQSMLLLYSNRRPEDAAFLDELRGLERLNKNFRLVSTMTNMSDSTRSWDGERRVIDEYLVKAHCGDLSAPIYYLAGPPRMVQALRQTLSHVGIADGDIRNEKFHGY